MKKTILVLSLSLFSVFLLTGCVVNQNTNQNVNENTNQITNQPIVGGDKDVHGCIGSAGYSWCEAKQKCLRIWEEGCVDNITILFDQLKKDTKINFGQILNNTELTWMVKYNNQNLEYKLPAYEMSAQEIKPEDITKVYNFFLTNGFTEDQNNQTVKSIAGHSIGYSYPGTSLVCGVGDQEKNLAVFCAIWNQNMISNNLDKEKVSQLFAEKYNKKIEDINLTINKQVNNYMSGGVKFSADKNAEGGIFLAVKIDNDWQLVYDGNGSVNCQELREKYQFPDEILKPNFCD